MVGGAPVNTLTSRQVVGAQNIREAGRLIEDDHGEPDAWLHSAPVRSIEAAREMGVQYLAYCGRWAWPKPRAVISIQTVADTADVCPDCRPTVLAWLEAER
jgi:hypothetical protein